MPRLFAFCKTRFADRHAAPLTFGEPNVRFSDGTIREYSLLTLRTTAEHMTFEHILIPRSVVALQAVKSACTALLFIAAIGLLSAVFGILLSGRRGDYIFFAFLACIMLMALTKEPLRTLSHAWGRRSQLAQLAAGAAVVLLGFVPGWLDPTLGSPWPLVALLGTMLATFAIATAGLAARWPQTGSSW